MKNWNIRKAKIQDTEGLQECMHLAYSKHLEKMNGEYLPPLDVDYGEEILNYPVWVVEEDNKIVGGLILVFDKAEASVANIATHPSMQGKGLGKFLMEFAEQEAKRRGYSEINLATHVLLKENVLFYEKLNWVQVDSDDKKVYMKKYLK